jgi:hypothetical protein
MTELLREVPEIGDEASELVEIIAHQAREVLASPYRGCSPSGSAEPWSTSIGTVATCSSFKFRWGRRSAIHRSIGSAPVSDLRALHDPYGVLQRVIGPFTEEPVLAGCGATA